MPFGWLMRPPSRGCCHMERKGDRTGDSLGITAPNAPMDRLKMRPDIMMVGLSSDDVSDKERRVTKKCKASKEEACMICPSEVT